MTSRDPLSLRLADLAEALVLLTRLPVAFGGPPRGAAAAWAWPIAGLLAGGAATLTGTAVLWFTSVPGIAAAFSLAAQMLLTGGLHEDGLADSADGLWGGRTRERRLEIMKDSRIGTFGMLALLVVTLVRWSALATLLAAGAWPAIIAAAVVSRAPMAVILTLLPNARNDGLSQRVGRPGRATALLGCALALTLTLALISPVAALSMAALAAVAAALPSRLAARRIGGQTGDVLGAAQQLAEMAALMAAVARL